MPHVTAITAIIVPLALAFCRLAGLLVLSPLLSSASVPVRARVFLTGALACACVPWARHGPDLTGAPEIALAVASETAIGYVAGLVASLPLLGLEMAGAVLGQQAGFGLGRVYNPELDSETDAIGQLLMWGGIGVFVSIGGLERAYAAVDGTFSTLPLGALWRGGSPLDLAVGSLSAGTSLAVRVSAPVVGVIVLLTLTFGVVGRTAPQVNIMAVGFTAKVMAALGVLAAAMTGVGDAAGDALSDALGAAGAWLQGLAGGANG